MRTIFFGRILRPAMPEAQGCAQLSVVIITLNEATRLSACLASVPAGAELVVLDSGSTDATCEVARAAGARVELRSFTNYAEQKNAAVAFATRPWIFSLDADEIITPALALSLSQATNSSADSGPVAYRVRRRLVFMGRALRFGKAIDHPVRLWRRGAGEFKAAIHEQLVAVGAEGELRGELEHFSYADLSDYFRRFNSYTSRIAENHANRGKRPPPLLVHMLRPWLEFFSRYVLRLGFLDGYPGYTYALLSSLYAYVKYAKLVELQAALTNAKSQPARLTPEAPA